MSNIPDNESSFLDLIPESVSKDSICVINFVFSLSDSVTSEKIRYKDKINLVGKNVSLVSTEPGRPSSSSLTSSRILHD